MDRTFFHSQTTAFEKTGEGVQRKILSYGEALMSVEVHFKAGASGEIHTHPHTQLTYVLEGEFVFIVGDNTETVHKGDTIYMLPNIPHGCTCTKSGILLDLFTPMREDFI